jgi:hypothetical protein
MNLKVGDIVLSNKSHDDMIPILGQITRISDFVALGDDRWSYRVLWFDDFKHEEYGAGEIQEFYFNLNEYRLQKEINAA